MLSSMRGATTWILFLYLSVLLIFGLDFKNYRVNVAPQFSLEEGVSFPNYSIIYSRVSGNQLVINPEQSVFVRFGLGKLRKTTNGLFEVLFSIEVEENKVVLIVGQWNEYLIFRQDDNFTDSQNASVFNIVPFLNSDTVYVNANISSSALSVMMNDVAVEAKNEIAFGWPEGDLDLYLGGFSDRTKTWKGNVMSLDLGVCTLYSIDDIETTQGCIISESWAAYNFMSNDQSSLLDWSSNGNNMMIGIPFDAKNWKWLANSVSGGYTSFGYLKDAFINLVGFIPFGFAIGLYRQNNKKVVSGLLVSSSTMNALSTALLLGFFVSLFIETTQVFIPSRVSSMHDLFFNATGTFIGCFIYFISKVLYSNRGIST